MIGRYPAKLDEKNRLAQEEILNTQKQIEIYNQMIADKQIVVADTIRKRDHKCFAQQSVWADS